jgi:hypothetical protein
MVSLSTLGWRRDGVRDYREELLTPHFPSGVQNALRRVPTPAEVRTGQGWWEQRALHAWEGTLYICLCNNSLAGG